MLADKLLLVLSSDSVRDVAGNALDGEWDNGADTFKKLPVRIYELK